MFSYESKFYAVTCFIYKMLVVNCLFIVTSLLIVTIPASLAATMTSLRNDRISGIASSYFRYFRQSFWESLPMGVFTVFSFLTMGQLSFGFFGQSFIMKAFILLACAFILGFNLELYAQYDEDKQEKKNLAYFRRTFYRTILNYHKLCLTFVLFGFVAFLLVKAIGTIGFFLLLAPGFYFIQKWG